MIPFRKKKKIEDTSTEFSNQIIYDSPKILFIDVDNAITEKFISEGYNVEKGTFGKKYKAQSNDFCGFNGSLPYLAEQEIVVINMDKNNEYADRNPYRDKECVESDRVEYYVPKGQNYFDPCNLYAYAHKNEFNKILENGGVLIIFTTKPISESYYYATIKKGITYSEDRQILSNYDWLPIYNRACTCVKGKEIYIDEKHSEVGSLILKGFEGEITYDNIFHLSEYDNAIPLYRNKSNEVISFIYMQKENDKNGLIILLPQFSNLYIPINNIFKEILPSINPHLFPYHVKNNWIAEDQYSFPKVIELTMKKNEIIKQYESDIMAIEEQINHYKANYLFMTNMLISQGYDEFLVENIKKVLEYIGYTSVINVDEIIQGKRQEDLRILDGNLFTIIEIKGHNGNPTEDDCQALLKYINRNMKKENRTDIHGVLIVNHQRILPPLQRNSPAFTMEQIDDAERDGYTLVSTWELFQSVRLIQEELITFEDINFELHKPGLFKALPKTWINIGKIEKLFKDKTIACIFLNVDKIELGNTIIIQDGVNYFKQVIKEMMVNEVSVSTAVKGEPVALMIDKPISKQSCIYIKI